MTASNVWDWIEDFKDQILRIQNQKVADEKWKYFPINVIFNIKLQLNFDVGQMHCHMLNCE